GFVGVLVARVHVWPEEVPLFVDEELGLLTLGEGEVEVPGQRLAEGVQAVADESRGLGGDLGDARLAVRAGDLELGRVLEGRLDLLRLLHGCAPLPARVLVEELGRDVETEPGEEARIHQTSRVSPSFA